MQSTHQVVGIVAHAARWTLPWIYVLAISAGIASAMTLAVVGGPVSEPTSPRGNISIAPNAATGALADGDDVRARFLVSLSPADVVADGSDARILDRSCESLFGVYNAWLFSGAGHGPCGLEPDDGPGSPTDR